MSEQQWYFERNGQDVGPFQVDDLPRLIDSGVVQATTPLKSPDGRRSHVAEVLACQAALAAEASLPPTARIAERVAYTAPPDAPVAATIAQPAAPVIASWRHLKQVADAQQTMYITMGLGAGMLFLVNFVRNLGWSFDGPAWEIAGKIIGAATAAVFVWLIVQWAAALELNRWLWGILALVPLVNFLVLLYLSRCSTRMLQDAGIKAGLLGTTLPTEPPAWYLAHFSTGASPGMGR